MKRVCGILLMVAVLLLGVPVAQAQTETDDIRVNWNGETRLTDSVGGNFWKTAYYTTGANGQLQIWRPEALRDDAEGDGNAALQLEVELDMTKYPYFYLEMEETSPVPLSFFLTSSSATYYAFQEQVAESGRVYKFRWEKEDKPGKAAEFMAGQAKYQLHVVAHFGGSFSDDTRVKIKYAYFGNDTLERIEPSGAEAIKLDFAGAMMDSMTILDIHDDLSMEVTSDFDGTYSFHQDFYVNLQDTPYIYVDIQDCKPGDVWYLDLNNHELEMNCRPLGFIGIGGERQVFRIDIRDYLDRIGLEKDAAEATLCVAFLRTDEDEVDPITVNGIYFGDEYFSYEGMDAMDVATPVDTEITPAFVGGGLSVVWWIIIGGAAVAAVVVIVFLVLYFRNKKKAHSAGNSTDKEKGEI